MNGDRPPSIRRARADDVQPVLALWRDSGAAPSISDDAASIRRLIKHDPGAMFLAVIDGAVIGSVIATWDGWRGGIFRLVVDPSWRRRRVGSALVEAAEDRLRTLGAPKVGALVLGEEAEAVAFWEAVGYERDDRVTRYVRVLV